MNEEVQSLVKKTQGCFPKAFVNSSNELIFDPRSNLYFRLEDVENHLDFLCKMFAWLSRPISKSLSDYKSRKILKSFNQLLGTNFTKKEMLLIYDRLGNDVNRKLCMKFIESNYDLSLLMKKEIISSCCAFGTDGTEDVHVLVEDCPIKRKDTQRERNKYLSVPKGRENPVLHECQCIYNSGYYGGVHMIPPCENYKGTKKVKREGRTRYKVLCAALEN